MKLMAIGFPKSGTTSLTRALYKSGLMPVHWRTPKEGHFVGVLMYRALYSGKDPFALLPGIDAVTQADVCIPSLNVNLWPNLDFAMLSAVRRAAPVDIGGIDEVDALVERLVEARPGLVRLDANAIGQP